MTIETLASHKPGRLHTFLRWSARTMFAAGLVLLAVVATVTLEARLYQAQAKRSLENELQTTNESKLDDSMPFVKGVDVIGRIDIPRLGLSVAVLSGSKPRMLRLGVGHIEGTPLPWEAGNSGIAGHRDTFFRDLKDVRTNDEIQIQTATELIRYQVDWVKVVAPDDTSVLTPSTAPGLTLVTCYPFYFVGPAPSRFVVHAIKN